jgi:hypothetical protein
MPEIGNLRIQIIDREGSFPPNALQPSDVVEVGNKSKLTIVFPDVNLNLDYFKIEFSNEVKGSNLNIEVDPLVDLPGAGKPKFYSSKDLANALVLAQNAVAKIQASIANLGPRAPPKDLARLNKKLDQAKKINDFFQSLDNLCPQLHKQGKIHFSVYLLYDKYKVELFTSKPPPPAGTGQPAEMK